MNRIASMVTGGAAAGLSAVTVVAAVVSQPFSGDEAVANTSESLAVQPPASVVEKQPIVITMPAVPSTSTPRAQTNDGPAGTPPATVQAVVVATNREAERHHQGHGRDDGHDDNGHDKSDDHRGHGGDDSSGRH